MRRTPVGSTAIFGLGYDHETSTLEVEFRSGRVLQYAGVTPDLHAWLMLAASRGGIFNRIIQGRYVETDVTPLPAEAGLEELSTPSFERAPAKSSEGRPQDRL